jgi:hypothetical protein
MIAATTALEDGTSIERRSHMTAQTSGESEESGRDQQSTPGVDIEIYVAGTVTNEAAVLDKINDLTIFPGDLGKRGFEYLSTKNDGDKKQIARFRDITEGELNDVDPTKSIIVTLIDGILRLLQGVFKHNYELIIKAAIDNVVTTVDFDSIAGKVWDQLKKLRDDLVSSLVFFAESINILKDEYKREFNQIVTDTKQYIDNAYLPDVLYNSMTSQLHSLEERDGDFDANAATGINVSLFFQHSSFNTLRTALIAVTSSDGANTQLEGKYGVSMRHWIGHQYKYTSYKLFIDQ